MSTVTRDTTEEVFLSEAEVAALFLDAVQMFRERCGAWFTMLGHRRAILLLAEHPTRHVFWLVAPEGEGRFLAMQPWTDDGTALIDVDEDDWPERVHWAILARLPFTVARTLEKPTNSAQSVSKPTSGTERAKFQ